MCDDLNVPYLGNLPLDSALARCCDEGKNYLTELPDSLGAKCLNEIVESMYFS